MYTQKGENNYTENLKLFRGFEALKSTQAISTDPEYMISDQYMTTSGDRDD